MNTSELPTTFGKYYLTDKLATGGMAEIFLGKLIGPGGFERQLVIKQIHPALSGQRQFIDLFVAEAKTLVSLTHGNIVPVYELGVIDDTYFIAMEYIDGPTLYQLTEARFRAGGALEPALAGWITAEIARGLDYAHRKGSGIVHRDLSPRNVMLSREGEVKIVDFGIAVDPGSGDRARTGDDDAMPTGSFAYMSPEQVGRMPLTGRSDLFSLGVLAWEMLVGERLFARPTPEATLEAVREAPIAPPSSRRPTVPERLDAIVLRALERDPARRWASAAELLAPLQRYLFSLEETPGPREVAALVAASCPPSGRRLPTERGGDRTPARSGLEVETRPAEAEAGDGGPSTRPMEGGRATPTAGDHGPSTPPMADRGPSTRPTAERRRRRSSVREATFATHVDLQRALAAPEAPAPVPVPVPIPAPVPDPPLAPAPPRGDDAPVAKPGERTPPGRRGALAAALVAIAAVVAVLLLRPCSVRHPAPLALATDAAPAIAIDAAAPPTDAAAAIVDAAPTDAGVTHDARRISDDVHHDATTAPAATGSLKVGADPWGEVYLDGHRLGRTPHSWPVTPGAHVVEVVFPSEQGELRRRFPITVTAGGEARVFADFSAAGSGSAP